MLYHSGCVHPPKCLADGVFSLLFSFQFVNSSFLQARIGNQVDHWGIQWIQIRILTLLDEQHFDLCAITLCSGGVDHIFNVTSTLVYFLTMSFSHKNEVTRFINIHCNALLVSWHHIVLGLEGSHMIWIVGLNVIEAGTVFWVSCFLLALWFESLISCTSSPVKEVALPSFFWRKIQQTKEE